ncbi:hypothetical protein IFM89_027892 [Coptis chinensis]|uniref:Uncharacterized protein n=1 Tax=Coptis chinensis TaxID=261450 RepID=A0A835HHH6_9MAGN|nr:hypothetical protein IFM89_027892 [Coptis chinensis]
MCIIRVFLRGVFGVIEIARRFSTNENTITVGGSYAIDDPTMVKARLTQAMGSLGPSASMNSNPSQS